MSDFPSSLVAGQIWSGPLGTYRLVAFTDDDCRAHPSWLESLIAASDGATTRRVCLLFLFTAYRVS